MPIVVTTPYSSYRKGSLTATIVKEVSGVPTGDAARAACGIEKYTSVHPEDQNMICTGWDAQKISIDFFSLNFSFGLKDYGTNERPTRIAWDTTLSSEPFDRDLDGNPIVNSALDAFDSGTQIEVPDLYFTVIKSMRPPFDVQRAVSFIGTVNDGDMTIQGHTILDGQCFCKHIAPAGEYTLSAQWLDVVHEFQMRKQGFQGRFLDQGLRGWFTDRSSRNNGPTLTEIFHPTGTLTDGNPSPRPVQISSAVRLDGKGKPIEKSLVNRSDEPLIDLAGPPKGAVVDPTPDGKAFFLLYKKYPKSKFQLLNL